MTGYKSLFTDT